MKLISAPFALLAMPLLLVGAADIGPKVSLNTRLPSDGPLSLHYDHEDSTSLARRSASNCNKASQCPTVKHANSTCKRHVCGFQCHKGYKAVGNSCAQTCTQASCCKVPANAIPACHSKICSWTCKKGYEKRGGKCVLKPGTCRVAKDCPKPPKNGHAVCFKNRCSVACEEDFDFVAGQCIPSLITATGLVHLHEYGFEGTIGYLSAEVNELGQYGQIVKTPERALKVTFRGPLSSTFPGKVTLKPPHPTFPDLPQFASVAALNNINGDLGPGLYNFAFMCPGVLTDPFALPAIRDNAFTRTSTIPVFVESTIFFRDETGELTARYTNTDGSSVEVFWVLLGSRLVLTGDVAELKNEFGGRQVRVEIL